MHLRTPNDGKCLSEPYPIHDSPRSYPVHDEVHPEFRRDGPVDRLCDPVSDGVRNDGLIDLDLGNKVVSVNSLDGNLVKKIEAEFGPTKSMLISEKNLPDGLARHLGSVVVGPQQYLISVADTGMDLDDLACEENAVLSSKDRSSINHSLSFCVLNGNPLTLSGSPAGNPLGLAGT